MSIVFDTLDVSVVEPAYVEDAPETNGDHSTLEKVSRVALIVLIGTIVGACTGEILAGVVIGFIGGIGFELYRYSQQRDLTLLNQMLGSIADDQLRGLIENIKKVVRFKTIEVVFGQELHALYDRVTEITDFAVTAKPRIKEIWETFLRQMKDTPVYYSDGTKVSVDFSRQIDRLNGIRSQVIFKQFTFDSGKEGVNIPELEQVERECFGTSALMISTKLNAQFIGVVAEDAQTQEVLGFLYASQEQERIHINSIGRKAGAAGLKIGSGLFDEFLRCRAVPTPKLSLQVRVSNMPARTLYEKYNFRTINELENYYFSPTENGLYMERLST